jgi:hypothetical protein
MLIIDHRSINGPLLREKYDLKDLFREIQEDLNLIGEVLKNFI